MTDRQQQANQAGWDDRMASKSMVESWTLDPHVANAYLNGYREACEALAAHDVPTIREFLY
ncbi:hypothetical protein [Caulobacter sp. UC70_42]|uniref:hypothetical protein n=1 Tax=Caulobacter sp. UC70_42 TaxID=3374551 RepID=UPI0037575260